MFTSVNTGYIMYVSSKNIKKSEGTSMAVGKWEQAEMLIAKINECLRTMRELGYDVVDDYDPEFRLTGIASNKDSDAIETQYTRIAGSLVHGRVL